MSDKTYFDLPHRLAGATDPQTSKDAANAIGEIGPTQRYRIMLVLLEHPLGLTPREVFRYGAGVFTEAAQIQKRLKEMEVAGWIELVCGNDGKPLTRKERETNRSALVRRAIKTMEEIDLELKTE